MLLAWVGALLLPLLVSAQDSAFVQPVLEGANVEFYDKDGVRYGIFLDKASFEEARQTCLIKEGNLVEFTDTKVPEFIARALAESAIGFSTLWVGGQYVAASNSSKGYWHWLTGVNITTNLPANYKFPMNELPFWVSRPDVNSNETECLVTDRNNHHRPLITGLPCTVLRPYICALPVAEETSGPNEIMPAVQVAAKTFHLFRAEYTWSEALTFCTSLGMEMAVVTRPEEFTQIQNRMRRVRPIVENAWIGGAFLNGRWVWVPTNEEISTNTGGDRTNPLPWFRPENIIMDGCLLADRHVCDYFVYLEAKCDRKRSVICQEDVASQPGIVQQVNGSNLFASTIRLSWEDAKKKCVECLGEKGTLLQLAGHNATILRLQMKWLFTAMTVLFGTEIRHMWLNAQLSESDEEFKWERDPSSSNPLQYNFTVDPEQFSNLSKSVLSDKGDHGFVMFCPGNFKTDPYLKRFKCLNLDRENLKHFFMYGLDCDYKQHFMCTTWGDEPSAAVLQDTCKKPITVTVGKRRAHVPARLTTEQRGP